MKKYTPLLLIGLLALLPQLVHAESSSLLCAPAIECDANQDYYAGSCKTRVNNVANDCPAAPFGFFSAFSCDYGCYVRSRPEFQECAGGVMVDGQCLTSMYVVNKESKNYVWDGVQLVEIGGGNGVDGLWKTDNNIDIYRDTGKVGIGVNAPNYSLDIAGDLNLNNGKSGAALYASNRQMLWYNPDPALNWVSWGLDADKNFFPKKVGIGVLPDEDVDLDVNGAVSINKGGSGVALYASKGQMLWYNPDPALKIASWGLDANSNLFGKPVGIGAGNTNNFAQLFVSNTDASGNNIAGNYIKASNSGAGGAYGSYSQVSTSGGGAAYGSYDDVSVTGSAIAYGQYAQASTTGDAPVYGVRAKGENKFGTNVTKVYGVYSQASNLSNNCNGPDCAEAIGVYGSSLNTGFGTGGYFEGGYVGVHAVAKSSNLNAIGLWVENNDVNSTAALFECNGSCTSAIFQDGNDASAATNKSGYVIIGQSGANHLAFDDNEIMAKSSGTTSAPLYLNADGGGVKLGTGAPSYRLELENVATNIGGRGLANAWNTYSDTRVKLNQEPIQYGLSTLMDLQAKTYDHYSGTVKNGKVELGKDYDHTIGLIAQEVFKVIPEAVNRPEDESNELWTLDYDKLIPVLIQAIQELKHQKDQDIAELKRSNEMLKTLVCQDHPESKICQ